VNLPGLIPAIPNKRIQTRLMVMAAVFVCLYAAILTLSPTVRLRSWNAGLRIDHWAGVIIWLLGFILVIRQSDRSIPGHSPYLIPLAAILSGWGLLTIWRLDSGLGMRQAVWLAASLAIVWIGLKLRDPLGLLRRYKYLWLTGGLLLAVLTFIFGTYPGGGGPRLWLDLGGVYFQPSEPLKLLLVVYLAAYLADRLPISFNLMQLLTPTLVLVGATLVILVAQRDLGTASLFIFLYAVTIYLASGRRRVLLISGIVLALAGVAGYYFFSVIRVRVDSWVNPWLDPSGRSYQVVQSILSIAAGGIFGRGPGLGNPGIVPVAYSDFIFSAIAEESGLLGTIALILIIAMLVGIGFLIAMRAQNMFQRYLAAGLTAYVSAQSILIIGGNLRLLPLTGVTLPFVSYGGSSLITSFAALLLLCLMSDVSDNEPAALPTPNAYLVTAGALIVGLIAIALVNVWWGFIRQTDLLARPDNPRRIIANTYVKRGSILDRDNQVIAESTGQPGSYTRLVTYPPLSPIIGYASPLYGFAGLEDTMDPYLRGLEGTASLDVLTSQLLYSQPPEGLNVRLSIQLKLQELADQLIGKHTGSLVLLNARTGEILAMASHPYYDPNQLDQKWNTWAYDPSSPFLNRATQGQYPPGTALSPFLLATVLYNGQLPPLPASLSLGWNGKTWDCDSQDASPSSWGAAVSQGCPAAQLSLGKQLRPTQILDLYRQLGFDQAPDIPLPVTQPSPLKSFNDLNNAILGEEAVKVSPLQMALAAAAFTTNGTRPGPRLAMAIDTPQEGWVILQSGAPVASIPNASLSAAERLLQKPDAPIWQFTGLAQTDKGPITWFLAGTNNVWQGIPLAMAVVLEEDNPEFASSLGDQLIEATLQP
jgi:cell division protein FtsW (lipid II flippase)